MKTFSSSSTALGDTETEELRIYSIIEIFLFQKVMQTAEMIQLLSAPVKNLDRSLQTIDYRVKRSETAL